MPVQLVTCAARRRLHSALWWFYEDGDVILMPFKCSRLTVLFCFNGTRQWQQKATVFSPSMCETDPFFFQASLLWDPDRAVKILQALWFPCDPPYSPFRPDGSPPGADHQQRASAAEPQHYDNKPNIPLAENDR